MLCPRCGHENPDDARFCVCCGAPFGREASGAPGEWMDYEEEKPVRRSRAPLVCLLVVLILAAAGAGLSLGWYRERGEWPWETLRAQFASSQASSCASSHAPMLIQPEAPDYNAAALAAAVEQSGFQAFQVTENEISGIHKDQNLPEMTSYRFTVTKPMAVLHMEIGVPNPAQGADGASSAAQAARVTGWSVDTWKLTGVWNDSAGNSLVIASCEAGALEASFVPLGSTVGIALTGTVSSQGTASLLGTKTQVSGAFSPAGTASLAVKFGDQENRPAQFVMLSTAVPAVPQAPPAGASSEAGQRQGEVFLHSSERLLTALDFVPVLLSGKAREQLALARNEIYARHGLDFETEPYRSHFYALDWYQKLPKVKEVPDSALSDIERQNLQKIQQYAGRY